MSWIIQQSDLEGVNQVSLVASPLASAATSLVVSTTLLDTERTL
jgi:hypothetical protein